MRHFVLICFALSLPGAARAAVLVAQAQSLARLTARVDSAARDAITKGLTELLDRDLAERADRVRQSVRIGRP